MKLILLPFNIILYLFLLFASVAHAYVIKGDKILLDNHPIANIEVLKKGTLLFHWSYLTEQSITTIRSEGKVPSTVFSELKAKTTFTLGGGLYASLEPLDSMGYGNRVSIFILPHDIMVARFKDSQIAQVFSSVGLQYGISALMANNAQSSWLNLIDESTVSHQLVPTPEEFVKVLKYYQLSSEELKELTLDTFIKSYYPQLANNSDYMKLLEHSIKLESQILRGDVQADIKILQILRSGSRSLKKFALNSLKTRSDLRAMKLIEEGLKNPDEIIRVTAIHSINRSLKSKEAISLLKRAAQIKDVNIQSAVVKWVHESSDLSIEIALLLLKSDFEETRRDILDVLKYNKRISTKIADELLLDINLSSDVVNKIQRMAYQHQPNIQCMRLFVE